MDITTVGIDLETNVFSVHGVDGRSDGSLLRCPPLGSPTRCARPDAHIIAPRFVILYRKNGKNDGNDAEAICEAASRPAMRFVPVKSSEQQAVLCLHRIRIANASPSVAPSSARSVAC